MKDTKKILKIIQVSFIKVQKNNKAPLEKFLLKI